MTTRLQLVSNGPGFFGTFSLRVGVFLCALLILPSGLANAQSRVRSRSTSSAGRSSGGEQRARDSWQPVRVAQVPRKKFVATPLRQTTFQDEEVAPLADAVDAAAGEIKGGMTPRAAADGNARANANANRQPAPVPNQALPISPSPLPPATVMTPMPGEIVYQDAMPMTHGGGCGDCGTSRCRTQACNGSVYPSIGAFLFGTRGGSCGGCDGAGCDSMGCDSVGCGCGACGTGAWSPCNIFRGPRDAWVSVEGLVWAPAGMRVPPLVTTSPTGSARAAAGVLEQTGTSTLVGGEILDDDFSGVRLRFGFFLDACHEWGITGEYFDTDSNDYSFFRNSTGDPILARPFFNTETGLEDSELVAFPNVVSGSVAVDASTQLQGWSLALTRQVFCNSGCGGFFLAGNPSRYTQSLNFHTGYRWLELDDSIRITEDLTSTDTANPGEFDITDSFESRNQFSGVDFGFTFRRVRGRWTLDLLSRLGLGTTRQTVTIAGSTAITQNGATQNVAGGLLAQRTNSGTFKRNQFSVVPELGATVGYQLTPRLRGTLGYTWVYWSQVARAGSHIPTDVNPNLLPPERVPFTGSNRPAFRWDDDDYWAQGFTYGLEYRW